MNENVSAAPAVETPAIETPVDPNAPKPGEKVYEVKYPDGRTEKRGESWMVERAQKSVGLEKRVSDADKYEKAFGAFVAKVQDPTQLLELLKHPDLKYDEDKQEALVTSMLSSKNPRIVQAVKRWIYDNEIVPSQMDPKDREAMEWKQKAEKLESDKLKEDKERKELEEAQKVSDIKESYRKALGESYTKSGLPVDDFLVRQVMEKARLYIRAGKHPDFDNCCKLVQQDFINQSKSVLGKATVDNILTMLDGETAQTINKALLKALNKKEELPTDPNAPKSSRPRKEKEKTPEEKKRWLKNLERGIVD